MQSFVLPCMHIAGTWGLLLAIHYICYNEYMTYATAALFLSNRVSCVHRFGQDNTREPADSDLNGEAFMDPALANVWITMCLTWLAVSVQM